MEPGPRLATAAPQSTDLASGLGLRRLLAGSVRLVQELLRPQTTACLVLDDAAEGLVCLAAAGARAEELADYALPLGRGLAGAAVTRGETVTVSAGSGAPDLRDTTARAIGLPVSSGLCVPLRSGEDVFGAIEALNASDPAGFSDRDHELLALVAEQTAATLEVASRLERTRHGFQTTVEHLADLLTAPEASAQCHPQRALPLVDAVAHRLGVSDEMARVIELTHILHDIGAGSVGQELPHQPRELTADERAAVREHASVGALLLQPLVGTWMSEVVAGVKHHHEWVDGSGYPDGLQGEQIPLAARVAAVVHAYLAMTEGRPYRAALSPEEAVTELRGLAGRQFDPEVVEALAAHIAAACP